MRLVTTFSNFVVLVGNDEMSFSLYLLGTMCMRNDKWRIARAGGRSLTNRYFWWRLRGRGVCVGGGPQGRYARHLTPRVESTHSTTSGRAHFHCIQYQCVCVCVLKTGKGSGSGGRGGGPAATQEIYQAVR